MSIDLAPALIRDRLAAAIRGSACDPDWVRLFDAPSADVVTPPARAGVQWRADWLAEPRALLAAAEGGGFGFALATDTALETPVADLLIAALRRRQPDVLTEPFRDRVSTAVHEATVNACVHGNLGVAGGGSESMDAFYAAVAAGAADAARAHKTVTVVATLEERKLTVDVFDQGAGHDAPSSVKADDADDGGDAYSGRGLALIRIFADSVTFADSGRHIRMTFKTPQAGDDGE